MNSGSLALWLCMFLDLRCLLDHANLFGILVCALFNIRLDWIFCMKVYIFLLHDFVVFAQFAALLLWFTPYNLYHAELLVCFDWVCTIYFCVGCNHFFDVGFEFAWFWRRHPLQDFICMFALDWFDGVCTIYFCVDCNRFFHVGFEFAWFWRRRPSQVFLYVCLVCFGFCCVDIRVLY